LGEGNLTLSSEFFQNLLTNPTKALAPEISAGQQQTQQLANENAQFAPRTGGTVASTNAAKTKSRGDIINLMGGAQTNAASNLASTGTNLLETGMSGSTALFGQDKTMHDQSMQQIQDIISSSLQVAEGVVGGLPGSPGGFGDVASNMLGTAAR
jgi:hypothetical protein